MISAQEIRQKALGKMNELANANRSATLEEFRELLVPEVVALVADDFRAVPFVDVQGAVERSVTIVANRLALDFDRLVEALEALSDESDTDPAELVPDTERPV